MGRMAKYHYVNKKKKKPKPPPPIIDLAVVHEKTNEETILTNKLSS